ncbi:MAG: type I-C CRISPR-associated protein Cas8c/Csd1 [Defluviitaleaceae bacterium]|nr:type I-C CRISPR-associated protein Cas8c/Csd1 [Defluviitaleaceae bacterium]
MIINALVNYYHQLLDDGEDVPMMGYTSRKVKYMLDINEQGELLHIVPHTEVVMNKKKEQEIAKTVIVPDGGSRSSGIKPYFLCDNAKHIFGFSEKHFNACKGLHKDILQDVDNIYTKAVLNFFEQWNPTALEDNQLVQLTRADKEFDTTNFVFRLASDLTFIHEDLEIKAAWDHYFLSQLGEAGRCLITGEMAPIARLHGNIKGIPGGQAAGVSLVSYNAKSFESFVNSPVSESAAFAYVATLNKLLASGRNKVRIGDTTVVFFSENNSQISDGLMGLSLGAMRDESEDLKGVFERLVQGQPVSEVTVENLESDFYIIGLAPNNARVAIRFFMTNTFDDFRKNINYHVKRFEIDGPPDKKAYLTPWELSQVALNKNAKEKNDDLIVSILKAILTNGPYPISFIAKILTRMKADIHGDETTAKYAINYRRVGMIKAYLLKQTQYKEEEITVALNKEFKEPAYLLGRLFATYEKIQEDDGGNVTIKSNYFASASVTPASIFPNVVKSGELYLQKLQGGLKVTREKLVSEIMSLLPAAPLPKNLTFEEQNLFVLGYYHQRQAFFTKKDQETTLEETK